MSDFSASDRTRVRRLPDRGHYDAATVHAIIDEALVCHLGFAIEGRPFVIPVLHARRDGELLVHGASSSRLLRHIEAGHEVCATMTLLDGLVLAKTAFDQSVNYRSVVVFGTGHLVDTPEEKLDALRRFTERLMPGQWDYVRAPSAQELKATSILAIPITEASAKVRGGPPKDDEADRGRPTWAGVVPFRHAALDPVPAEYSAPGVEVPAHVRAYVERHRG